VILGENAAVGEIDPGIFGAGCTGAKDLEDGRAVDGVDVGDVIDVHADDSAVADAWAGELSAGEAAGVVDLHDATGLFGGHAAAAEAGDAHIQHAAIEDIDV